MRFPATLLLPAAAALLIVGGGCPPSEIYTQWKGGRFGTSFTPKQTWRASGSVTNPQAAIDGNLDTIARSSYRRAGANLTIDLQKPCVFQTVIIDHGQAQTACARRVGVATSTNGRDYKDRYAGPGTRRITLLLLPGPVLARYIRLRVITPGRLPWAVGEIYIQ